MRRSRWFTLIEMLVVVVIMAVLMMWLMWMGGNAVRRAAFDNDKVLLVNYFNETLSEFMSSPYVEVWWIDQPVEYGELGIVDGSQEIKKKYYHGWTSTDISPIQFKWSTIRDVDSWIGPPINEAYLYLQKYAVWCEVSNTQGILWIQPWSKVWLKLQYGWTNSQLIACYRINMDACRLEEIKPDSATTCNYNI